MNATEVLSRLRNQGGPEFGFTPETEGLESRLFSALLDETERLRADNARLRKDLLEAIALISRYRNDTPLGNQPHMIAHVADDFIERAREAMEASNGK